MIKVLADPKAYGESWSARVDEDAMEDTGCGDTIGSGNRMRGFCLWLRFGSAGHDPS